MAASTASGITTLEGLAGKTVCVGESTTYLDWLEGKQLDFGTLSPTTTPPAGVKATTQKTDAECPQLWAAGRNDFEGFLSSSTTVDGAIKAGIPMVKVGDPVYAEPLAVAVDKGGPDPTDFVAATTTIVQEMHADGTLKALVREVVRARPDRGARAVAARSTVSSGGGADRRPHPFTEA